MERISPVAHTAGSFRRWPVSQINLLMHKLRLYTVLFCRLCLGVMNNICLGIYE